MSMESSHHWGEYQLLRHEYGTALHQQGGSGGTRWEAEARPPRQGPRSIRRCSFQAMVGPKELAQATRPKANMAKTTVPQRKCPTDPNRGQPNPTQGLESLEPTLRQEVLPLLNHSPDFDGPGAC